MKGRAKSPVVDDLLRFLVGGGVITTALFAPGVANVANTALTRYFQKIDKRRQQKELKRILYYMKQQGLITPTSDDYEHGLRITKKGRLRLKEAEFEHLVIPSPETWDQQWRIVFFDIPERFRMGRRQLIFKLKMLGFVQLQRSVWVHPFPCRKEIELVATTYSLQKYISYVEASSIDNQTVLEKRFKTLLDN